MVSRNVPCTQVIHYSQADRVENMNTDIQRLQIYSVDLQVVYSSDHQRQRGDPPAVQSNSRPRKLIYPQRYYVITAQPAQRVSRWLLVSSFRGSPADHRWL